MVGANGWVGLLAVRHEKESTAAAPDVRTAALHAAGCCHSASW